MGDYSYTIFSLFFLASSFLSFFVAFVALQKKRERGAKELALVMISAGIYAFAIIFETASTTLELKIFWSKMAYIGAVTVPLFYAFFVFRFVGKDKFLTKKNIVLLSIVPFILFVLALTNDYHNLLWVGYSAISPKTNLIEYYHGVGFWIGNVGYNYFLFALSSFYLISFIITRLTVFKLQAKIIFVASLCPWIASIFYISGLNIVPGFDIVPFSMILTGALLIAAIFGNRVLDLVPVAREVLMESLEEGILVLDFSDRIQDINKSARKYLGVDNGDIIGADFKVLTFKAEPFRDIVLSRELKQTVVIQEEDIATHYIVDKYEIAGYPGSRLVVFRNYSEDVRREQKLRSALKQAEESDKMKSSFLANITHEVRTPLNIITGFIDILYTSNVSEKDKEVYIELIKKNSNRIMNTLNDIVEVSKIESGQISIDEIQINLNETMDHVYNLYFNTASEKKISFTCSKGLGDKESLIYIDRVKLTSVLSNLIDNAFKFTIEGNISFGYFLKNNKLTFYVEDSGIGISKERQSVIFKQFVQAEQSMSRSYEGSGLGLSIVKHYVSLMGGKILIKSDLDKGSRFFFSLDYNPVIIPDNL